MPWRLIVFILIFAVFLVFISFNLENKCDVGFGFFTIPGVPVFITIFVSFVIGLFSGLPIVMQISRKKKEGTEKERKPRKENPPSPPNGGGDAA